MSAPISTDTEDPFTSPSFRFRNQSSSLQSSNISTPPTSTREYLKTLAVSRHRQCSSELSRRRLRSYRLKFLVFCCVSIAVLTFFCPSVPKARPLRNPEASQQGPQPWQARRNQHEPIQQSPPSTPSPPSPSSDPERWLRENNEEALAADRKKWWWSRRRWRPSPRPRAAIISLVRNEELDGIMQSMRQLEYRWNSRYSYPWVFFNDKPFSEEFKAKTSNLTSAKVYYELIPIEHWSTPEWVDEDRYMDSLDYLGTIGVGKGWMLSYRNMCRWNSGFFYKHPRLLEFDFYWRVEPEVHFFCNIPYDPFTFLRDNNMIYGFNMAILDDARSFPSLWTQTLQFITQNPHLLPPSPSSSSSHPSSSPSSSISWLLDSQAGTIYNNCQFFSNFEIGDLRFFRGEANQKYFDYLDKRGGFYYERFGDAPIHTLSVAMFGGRGRTWFFRDVGYQHEINRHCPKPDEAGEEKGGDGEGSWRGECDCEPTDLDENFYKLVPLESPQVKPGDSCVRLWLDQDGGGGVGERGGVDENGNGNGVWVGKGKGGVDWLGKREGWSQDADRAFGGDGYGGYVNS